MKSEILQWWISVKEILPEKGERVLVYAASQGVQICYIDIRGKWRMHYDASEAHLNITDWMPLPDAPKEPIMVNEESGKELSKRIYNMLTNPDAVIRPSELRIEDLIKGYAVKMCEEQKRICKDYTIDCHLPLDLIG